MRWIARYARGPHHNGGMLGSIRQAVESPENPGNLHT
jgi:hypothetical protein